jgi:pilus assembly protein CpaE
MAKQATHRLKRALAEWAIVQEGIQLKSFKTGIVVPNTETAESLISAIRATGMADVVIQSGEYYSSKTDWSMRRLAEANPEIIILEIRDEAAGLRCLKVLHSVLPKAHLLVVSHLTDSQLVIEAMRSGAREFVPLPVTSTALAQAFSRYAAETEQRGTDSVRKGKLYSVISAKSGSGATTVALNLAGVIAEGRESKVGVLDLGQPVGDVAAYLNLKPMFTITEAVEALHRLDSVLLESFMTSSNGFHVLAGVRDYTSAQFSVEAMGQLLDVSMHTFAHTFADLSECVFEDQANVVASMSTAILLVITPNVPSIWRAERLMAWLSKMNHPIKIVLNRKSRFDEVSEADIEKLLHHQIDFTLPNDYSAAMKALNSGRLLDPKEGKNLSRMYRELAEKLAGLPPSRRGLLDMFLKTAPARVSNI